MYLFHFVGVCSKILRAPTSIKSTERYKEFLCEIALFTTFKNPKIYFIELPLK
ncbi:hypothetical protein LEP1GSC066_3558 [Leptospira sp. serovar Kenya str. Sh9]|nr:hypothetical protein LEP1GSC066_3558 [Leptospira sp. serovar Kenya str. Sh9]